MSRNLVLKAFQRYSYLNSYLSRLFASKANPAEVLLKEKLSLRFPSASLIQVDDISGGCGSMYQIHVETTEFKGLNTVKQHQLITQTLKEEIKNMHGLRITTSLPPKAASES